MKIDSFYQCLTYVRSVSQEVDGGSLSEWLLPLVGVVVGFVLSTLASLFSAYWKEGRIKKSILAEVSLVKSQAEKTFKATIEMMYEVNKLPPDATPYQPSATLSIFLFQQLFSGVAHRFKATQIEQFQYLQAHVKTVNDKVAWLTDSQRARGAEFWDYSYKVIADSARLIDCCDGILTSTSGRTINAYDLAEKLGISSEAITSVLGEEK